MKVAVVTGASSGLGREFVRLLGEQESGSLDEIWVIARRRERLEELKETCSIPVRPVPMDLTLPESINSFERILVQEKPDVKLLINAAGFGKIGNYRTVGRQESDGMIELNIRAAVDMTYAVLPYMTRGSRIMEICSTAGFQPFQYLNVYAASKAFLYRFTRALRIELMPRGIRVTAVCPYWIRDTEFIPTAQKTETGVQNSKTEEHGLQDRPGIRHFPLSSRVSSVAGHALTDSRLGLPVSTPGIVCTVHRIAAKFIPSELMMGIWELLRRV